MLSSSLHPAERHPAGGQRQALGSEHGGQGRAERFAPPSPSSQAWPCRPAVASAKMAAPRGRGSGGHGGGGRPAGPEPGRAAGDAEAAAAAAGGSVSAAPGRDGRAGLPAASA